MYPEDLEEPSTPSRLISNRRLLSLPETTRRGADTFSTRETVTRRSRYVYRDLWVTFWNRCRQEYIPALREFFRLKSDSTRPDDGDRWHRQCMYMMNLFPVRNEEWKSFTSWSRKSTRRQVEHSSALQKSSTTPVSRKGNPESVQVGLKETPLQPRRQEALAGE